MTATTPGVACTSLRSMPRNRAARHRRAADGDMQRADRLRNVVDIFGAALHVLGAAVVRQRLVDVAQRRLDAASLGGIGDHPVIGDARDVGADAGDFGERLDDQIAGDAAAIGGAGAQIGERREILADGVGRRAPARAVSASDRPRSFSSTVLARLGMPAMPPNATSRLADPAALDASGKTPPAPPKCPRRSAW